MSWSPKYDLATFLEELAKLDRKGDVDTQTCDYADTATWDMEES